MAWWSALSGAASGGGGGIASLSPSMRAQQFIADRDAKRKATEFRNQTREEGIHNYDAAMKAYDRGLDLAPTMSGQLTADFDNAGNHVATDRDQIGGGALKTQLDMSQGYNPTMAFNPYMQIFDADKRGVSRLKATAEKNTEQTLQDWEASQAKQAASLEDSFAAQRAERDNMRDVYATTIEDAREEDKKADAEHIIEAWILSSDRHGAEGGPGTDDDMLKRTKRRVRRLGAGVAGALGAPGLFAGGKGRVQGASGTMKRDYIEERLQSGDSYADILNDEEFTDTYLKRDVTAAPLYRTMWED